MGTWKTLEKVITDIVRTFNAIKLCEQTILNDNSEDLDMTRNQSRKLLINDQDFKSFFFMNDI